MQTFFPIFSEKSQKFFIFVNFEAIFCKHKQYPPKSFGPTIAVPVLENQVIRRLLATV